MLYYKLFKNQIREGIASTNICTYTYINVRMKHTLFNISMEWNNNKSMADKMNKLPLIVALDQIISCSFMKFSTANGFRILSFRTENQYPNSNL